MTSKIGVGPLNFNVLEIVNINPSGIIIAHQARILRKKQALEKRSLPSKRGFKTNKPRVIMALIRYTFQCGLKIFLNKIPNIGAQCRVAAAFEKSKQ